MSMKQLAAKLGIESYPEKFDEIYENINFKSTEYCDIRILEKLEAEYEIFNEFLPAVIEGANDLAKNPDLLAWCNIASEYLKGDISEKEARSTPMPISDGSPAGDMLILFVLLSRTDSCIKLFENRGFSHEEIKGIFRVFYISINLVKAVTGRPGLNKIYFGWTMNYLLCKMYDFGSFNFELRRFELPVILLKNKESEEHVVLMTDGRFHKDGQILGSAGYLDEEGAFDAEFSETDSAFFGHVSSHDGYVSRELSVFSKEEWEAAVRPGDDIVSVHIPRNADLSHDAIIESYKGGLDMLKKRFPEHKAKYLYCYSWIIDSRLRALLGDSSKIVGFGDTFSRFAVSNSGRDGMSFFFLGHQGTDEELPENTSLQRKIKALYLNGGYTYSSAGFVTEVHL